MIPSKANPIMFFTSCLVASGLGNCESTIHWQASIKNSLATDKTLASYHQFSLMHIYRKAGFKENGSCWRSVRASCFKSRAPVSASVVELKSINMLNQSARRESGRIETRKDVESVDVRIPLLVKCQEIRLSVSELND